MGLRHMRGRGGVAARLRPVFATVTLLVATLALSVGAPGCTSGGAPTPVCADGKTCQVRLTIIHTSDIHSRVFPYDLQILQVDSQLGLGTLDEVKNVGGVARVSYVVQRERARSERVLHLDSGDIFEGAPIFNFFSGEPETRAESMMGTDAMVIGNHEFDRGATNAARQLQQWASFPVLGANYLFYPTDYPGDTNIGDVLRPFTVFDEEGLKVAVIGMGNLSSLASIFDNPNGLGFTPLNTIETAQGYVDLLRPYVDVVVILSHLGLQEDELMIQGTTGIDFVEGGHNHIVINPPQSVQDCSADANNPGYVWAVNPNIPFDPANPVFDPADPAHIHPNEFRRPCTPRRVLLSHSGAFAKYVGRFDLVLSNDPTEASPTGNPKDYDPNNGFEVVSSTYIPFPIDDSIPEDPRIVDLLQPYERVLDRVADLNIIAGFSPNGAKRIAPQGGDSPLGNLIANAMWLRLGIQTDLSMTNSTGIRTDMIPGPVTIEEMYNIFPFDNTITKMQLSGLEVQEMFDFIARRSSARGCQSQAQIAGSRVVLDCATCLRPNVEGAACTVDADCVGAELGSCAYTCSGNSNSCATDADCAPSNGGTCSGKCIVTACADAIYVGHETNCPNGNASCSCQIDNDCPDMSCTNTGNSCSSDADCQGVAGACAHLQGQCDLSAATNNGTGTCSQPLQLENLYDFATSNYLSTGGSGFRVLQRNTTQIDSRIPQRDAVLDYIRNAPPCGYDPNNGTQDGLKPCSKDSDCTSVGDFVCACVKPPPPTPGVVATGTIGAETCDSSMADCSADGSARCVRRDCRDSVATFHEKMCAVQQTPDAVEGCRTDLDACSLAGEECKILACVDQTVGAVTDNRVTMTGR
jgi:5'-nucleotidase/UDP-sugar diphosphatase